MKTTKNKVHPFLKWAGGKRWLIPHIKDFIPSNYNRYIEPFLGSGVLLFTLLPKRALISDINKDLVDTYINIAKDWSLVYKKLIEHDKKHSKVYYYKIRSSKPYSHSGRAARFIYLNRTCWNGLYRVNLKGEFNVPKGSKKRALLSTDNFEQVAGILKNCDIRHSDFESIIDQGKEGDFIFIDPPYLVKHKNNGFLKYNEKLFSWNDQIRLKETIERAKLRGCFILMTNTSHISIKKLYDRDKIIEIERNSVIAANINSRGVTKEILIRVSSNNFE